MRKHLLHGLAALSMGCMLLSCTHDFNYEEQEQKASIENAQNTLGFYIPANQDWVMTSTATATFNISGLNETNDTVYVFSNNPRSDGYGAVLASAPVTSATTTISDFRIPQHLKKVFVGLRESDGNMVYKYVDVEDGQITASYDYNNTPAQARTRSMVSEINDPFPSYTANEVNAKYKTTAPSTALTWAQAIEAITTHYQSWDNVDYNKLNNITEFRLTDGTYSMNVWYGSRDIYIDGNVTFNVSRSQALNQARFYLLPHSTLTLSMNNESYINNLEIYVAQDATLNYNYDKFYKQTGGGVIFNRGTINLQYYFQANNDAIIYNEGTVNGTNIISAPGSNNPSYFLNFGEIDLSGDFLLNSCANFYNEGIVTVEGTSGCTSGNIWWINKGHYTTKRFHIEAWNTTYYNYCQLIVQEDAYLHDGEFNLMPNSYFEAGSAECDNFKVNMYGNAGFYVKGDCEWGAQGDGIEQGFHAYNDKNYVCIGGSVIVAAHKYSLLFIGRVLAGIGKIIDLGVNNLFYGPDIEFRENSKEVKASEMNPTYDATDCGGSWTDDPGVITPPTENVTWTYAFEDNTTRCDFDMNDVVIQVKENSSNPNKLDVTLVAAGCEYDNYVYLGNQRITWPNGAEVHAALGVPSKVMVNTGAVRGEDRTPVTVTIDKPSSNFDFQNADFKIRPFKVGASPDDLTQSVSNDFIGIVKEGNPNGLSQAPLGIAIPDKWKWPKERVIVNYAYEGFTAWGKQNDLTLRADQGGWYQSPRSGTIYEE